MGPHSSMAAPRHTVGDMELRRLLRVLAFATALLVAGCGDGAAPAGDAGATIDAALPSPDAGEASDAASLADGATASALRVLFIGNSYTSVNDLPSVVQALGAATPGAAVEVSSVLVGSSRLSDHWTTTGARAAVETGGFDAVVLQGQSVEPLTRAEDFQLHAQLFADAVHGAGARPVWYATWARRAGDPFYDALESGGYPAAMTNWLETAYETAALWHGDVVARVGTSWQLALAELPDVVLYEADGSHPTAAGTLLAACVLLQAISGETPRVPDPTPLGIARETADALCALAPRVVCDAPLRSCDDVCVDLTWDRSNCGACGVTCAGTLPCNVGVCGCPIGLADCGDACVDLRTDRENCGACGTSCAASGMPCFAGTCGCPTRARLSPGFAAFTALRPGCVPWTASATAECSAAIHEYCAARECFESGFGSPGGSGDVICVAEGVRTTTYTELQTWVAACDGTSERSGADCSTAIHRYCVSTGAVTGFGPVGSAGDDVTVTCLARATLARTDYATLASSFPMCDGAVTRWGQPCNTASWFYCTSLGHDAGFGPVEVSGTDVDVACVDL